MKYPSTENVVDFKCKALAVHSIHWSSSPSRTESAITERHPLRLRDSSVKRGEARIVCTNTMK